MSVATPALLAIDQGTTNAKALLVGLDGTPLALGQCAVACRYPRAGWVEQSAIELWQAVLRAIERCLEAFGPVSLVGIGISAQRESALAWDARDGRPLGPVIGWQCRRTEAHCERLVEDGLDAWIRAVTGLPIDPLFSASKMRWLLDHAARDTPRERVRLGNVDSWLLWQLSGGAVHATDASNASRTQLCDITSGQWSPELAELFGIAIENLPSIHSSAHRFGVTRACGRLPGGVPIGALIGDSHAALFAQGGFLPGVVKATFGTGSSVMSATHGVARALPGLATTIAWQLGGERCYALEGNVTVSASILPWMAQLVGLDGSVERLAELAREADGEGAAILVPAMVGLGAPRWVNGLSGLIDGLSFSTSRAELARAAFDSIVHQIRDVVDAMRYCASGEALVITELRVDGGACANHWLMQRQADVLALPVRRSCHAELSALGAAYLAGLALGVWPDLAAIERLAPARERIEPRDVAAAERRHRRWLVAVERTLHRAGSRCEATAMEADA